MTSCCGTSSTCSIMLSLAPTRSMKGTIRLRPGRMVGGERPKRSTVYSMPCATGRTLMAIASMATTTTAMAKIPAPSMMSPPIEPLFSGLRHVCLRAGQPLLYGHASRYFTPRSTLLAGSFGGRQDGRQLHLDLAQVDGADSLPVAHDAFGRDADLIDIAARLLEMAAQLAHPIVQPHDILQH